MPVKLEFITPCTDICELLCLTGNLSRGMDRIWVYLGQIKKARPTLEARCSCAVEPLDVAPLTVALPLHGPKLPQVTLARVQVCLLKHDHPHAACLRDTYYIGQCARCRSVLWART